MVAAVSTAGRWGEDRRGRGAHAHAGRDRREYGTRVRGVGRAAEVLDLFSVERPYWGPTEVAAEVGVAKSSAYELLRELARAGLVERMACGKYRLGWRLVR